MMTSQGEVVIFQPARSDTSSSTGVGVAVSEILTIKQGPRAKVAPAAQAAFEAIRDGKVIVAPIEHSYVFIADAFNHAAVAKVHQLRGDDLGVAAQVVIRDASVVKGLSTVPHEGAETLAKYFWPGLLTIITPAQRGLTWNLGDSKELGKVALRVPSNRFMTALLALSGPLAIAHASLAKAKPPRTTTMIPALDKDLAYIIDAGELSEHPSGAGSTIVEIRGKQIHVIREGAISIEELITTHPSVVRPSADSAGTTA